MTEHSESECCQFEVMTIEELDSSIKEKWMRWINEHKELRKKNFMNCLSEFMEHECSQDYSFEEQDEIYEYIYYIASEEE